MKDRAGLRGTYTKEQIINNYIKTMSMPTNKFKPIMVSLMRFIQQCTRTSKGKWNCLTKQVVGHNNGHERM